MQTGRPSAKYGVTDALVIGYGNDLRTDDGAGRWVAAQIDALVAKHWVSRPGDWELSRGTDRPLNEAARCASWIQQQWLAH